MKRINLHIEKVTNRPLQATSSANIYSNIEAPFRLLESTLSFAKQRSFFIFHGDEIQNKSGEMVLNKMSINIYHHEFNAIYIN